MSDSFILIALIVFVVVAIVLVASTRGKASPRQQALAEFARQTHATVTRKVAGFATVVNLESDGWSITIEASSNQEGPGDLLVPHQNLQVSSEYRAARPYELQLLPKGAPGIAWAIQTTSGSTMKVGIEEIDHSFAIRTTDPSLAIALLKDTSVREKLHSAKQNSSSIYAGPERTILGQVDHEKGIVIFHETDETVTVARLFLIQELITCLANRLVQQGVAMRP